TVERERVPLAQFRTVSTGYFEAARIPLKRGRTFSERDTERTAPVAVVNEELARQWLDGLEPVGARLLLQRNDGAPRPGETRGAGTAGHNHRRRRERPAGRSRWRADVGSVSHLSTNSLGQRRRRGREHVLDRAHDGRPDDSWQQPGERSTPCRS